MSEWRECNLKDVAEIQTGPFGSQLKNEQYITGGTPVITVEHINGFRIAEFDYPSVTDEDKERLSKYLLQSGDIIFTRVGSVDLSAFVKPPQNGWMFSSRMLRVRVIQDVDSRFLSYFFQQKRFREYIFNISVGATMPSINTEILKSIPISYPSLPEQKTIAEVLSSLDDKIDLLHRQNKTLEQMAETLFRQWFVEEAREDWEELTIYDAIDLVGGGTPKTSILEYWDGKINWLSGGDITANHKGIIITSEKYITEKGLDKSSTKLLPKYAMVISARGTVGKYCMLSEPMAFSQSNYGIKPRFPNTYFFTYLLVAHSVDELQSAAYGSVFDTITTNTFKGHSVLLPKENVIQDFNCEVTPFFEKILNNSNQIHTLESIRNTLLPKLMSGEVRIASNG
ncbi:MAG: restriction endonuclease subunit S [Pseudomonadales bacterium]|nr:restriction endonuclease subunit S [Pseudomonadales bacterium]